MAGWTESKALNKVVAIVSGIAVVLSIIAIILVLQPKESIVALMSKSTGTVMEMDLPLGITFPVFDPKTGNKDLYPAVKVKCEKCGWVGYIIAYFEPGKPSEAKCPKCGVERKSLRPL